MFELRLVEITTPLLVWSGITLLILFSEISFVICAAVQVPALKKYPISKHK